MEQREFAALFFEAMRRALIEFGFAGREREICNAEVHAPVIAGGTIPLEEVPRCIYINSALFYKIIDVGIIGERDGYSVAFIRVSGHAPVPFSETYDPSDLGPFKVLAPFNPNKL